MNLDIRDRSKIRGGGGGRAGAFLFWPTSFGETLPIPGAEKMLTPQNSLHKLSWPPPTPPLLLLPNKGYLYCSIAREFAREFVKLFHHEGRRQYDSQQNIFKCESRLKSIMSSSNPAAAGKFYDDNYVILKSDQIIIRSNIKTMVDLQKNIQQEHMDTKNI